MDRIIIIGCGGAGKSTLARALGEKLKIPVIHLDSLFWQPGWVETEREAFDKMLQSVMEQPQWILDGNYRRTMAQRIARCDTVIYLDYSRLTCLTGVLKRVFSYRGKVRPDMGAGCPEKLDWQFLRWIWSYNGKHRAENYRLLRAAGSVNCLVFCNRRQTKRFLATLDRKNVLNF